MRKGREAQRVLRRDSTGRELGTKSGDPQSLEWRGGRRDGETALPIYCGNPGQGLAREGADCLPLAPSPFSWPQNRTEQATTCPHVEICWELDVKGYSPP